MKIFKKTTILLLIVALIAAATVLTLYVTQPAYRHNEQIQPELPIENAIQDKPAGEFVRPPTYENYLRELLADTGYTFTQVIYNDHVHYKLYDTNNKLTAFIFHGVGDGWGGPIYLFVKTDIEGNIRLVHVYSHSETPIYVVGLADFISTFVNFKVFDELRWQQDIHGLTGATITAEAIIAAVQRIGNEAFERGIFESN